MKAAVVVLRALGTAAGAFIALIGFLGISDGEAVGLFFVVSAVGFGLMFFCLRQAPIAKGIIISALVVFGLYAAYSGSTSSKPKLVSSGMVTEGTVARKVSEDYYGPGDTVDCNGVRITFCGVNETMGSEYLRPGENKIFALAEFEIENNTTQQINISSVFGSDAYCDDYLVQESISADIADPQGRAGLSGSIAPGKKLRGIIGYELPSQWQVLEIRIRTDWWKGSSSDAVIFVAEPA